MLTEMTLFLLLSFSTRYQRQQRKDGLLPHRTETLTLSPSRIRAHHPKCPKMLSHVLAGQLTQNPAKYPSPKTSNIVDHTVAIRNVTNAPTLPQSVSPFTSNNDLLNGTRNYNNYISNLNNAVVAAGPTKKADNGDNVSSPDLSDWSMHHADRFRFAGGAQVSGGELASATAEQQKTILLKIPNVSESELMVSESPPW